MVTDSFTYLGIKITPKIDNSVSANYDAIIESVIESIKRWSTLPISFERTDKYSQNECSSKFLYLFQGTPLSPPDNFFFKNEKYLL